MKWKEGNKWEETDAFYVQSDDDSICPFCESTEMYSGASGPEVCKNCDAVWYIGLWRKEKEGKTKESI